MNEFSLKLIEAGNKVQVLGLCSGLGLCRKDSADKTKSLLYKLDARKNVLIEVRSTLFSNLL